MTDERKITPEPGGVYRWYDWPGNGGAVATQFDRKVLHIALPSSLAEGVVRVITSSSMTKPWTQDYVPEHAVLMIPADRGVDVPPGKPRVIIRDLPDRLDFGKREHRDLFDRAISTVIDNANTADVARAASTVRHAMNEAERAADEAARMAVFREKAKELLTGTADQRLDAIAELMRQAEDGPEDEDYS